MKQLSLLFLLFFLIQSVSSPSGTAQITQTDEVSNAKITGIFRNVANVSDPAFIDLILNDFLIPESVADIERIEIIDVSNIGFGSNDILVIYPSRNVYMLDRPSSDDLLLQMQSWRLKDKRRDADNRLRADYFYPGNKDSALQKMKDLNGNDPDRNAEEDLVLNALISDLLSSLDRNYSEIPVSFRFERDQEGFTFQMWDFLEEALVYNERPDPDTVFIPGETTLVETIVQNKSAPESPQVISETPDGNPSANRFKEKFTLGSENLKRKLQVHGLIDFDVSFFSSFLNYKNENTNYHQGLGTEFGIRAKPYFFVFTLSGGMTYHPLLRANPNLPDDTKSLNFFGVGQIGLRLFQAESFYLNPLFGLKTSYYTTTETEANDGVRNKNLTFIGIEVGFLEPDIGIFVRQSLESKSSNQSLVEYGIRYGF